MCGCTSIVCPSPCCLAAPPAEFVKTPRRPVTLHLPLLAPGKAKQGKQRAGDPAAAGGTPGSELASAASATPGSVGSTGSDKKKGGLFSKLR